MEDLNNSNKNNEVFESSFITKKIRQNSPTTIEAMKRCGVDMDDVLFMTIKEFRQNNPELQNLSKEIQIMRYEYFESFRKQKLKEIIEERENLLYEQENNNNQIQNGIGNDIIDESKVKSAILNDEKSLEKLKVKYEREMSTLIQNELRNEINRRQNQYKLMAQREDDNKLYNAQLNHDSIFNLGETERQKSLEIKYKQEEYKKIIDRNFQERQIKILERQKKYEEKEEERRILIDQKMKKKHLKNLKKKEEKKKRVEITIKNLEEKARQRSGELEDKQIHNETKRIEFEETRQLKFVKRKEEAIKKGEQIFQVIMKNRELEKRKIKEYYDKQAILSLKKEEMEEVLIEEKKLKNEKIKERQQRINETLQNNENMETQKREMILEKIKEVESKKILIEKLRAREVIDKLESKSHKLFLRSKNIKKINHLNKYSQDKNYKSVEEKFKKFKDFSFQRQKLIDIKRKFCNDLAIKKSEIFKKFDAIFVKDRICEESIKELEKMFQDNPETLKLVECLKEIESSQPDKSKSINSKNNLSKTINKKINEKNYNNPPFFATEVANHDQIERKGELMQKQYKLNGKMIENLNIIPINLSKIINKEMPYVDEKNFLNKLIRTSKSQKDTKAFNNTHNKKNVSDLEKKIKNYRQILNQELMILLNEERQKEEERDKRIFECDEEEDRKRLDKLFGVERAIASNKIVNFNKEIDRKVIEFERKIKTAFN